MNGFATHCRFREGKRLSTEETEAFGKYFYHITAQRGSGEFALSHLLGPMAWARHPLEGRMHQMQVSSGHNYFEHSYMASFWVTARGMILFSVILMNRCSIGVSKACTSEQTLMKA